MLRNDHVVTYVKGWETGALTLKYTGSDSLPQKKKILTHVDGLTLRRVGRSERLFVMTNIIYLLDDIRQQVCREGLG